MNKNDVSFIIFRKSAVFGKPPGILLGFIFFSVILFQAYSDDKVVEETEQIELDEVVITATRTEDEILEVPQHVTVITATEIQKSNGKNIAKVLETKAGLSLTDYGPTGSLQALSFRGSTTAQVLVLINGVRAFGSHGGGDMSLIPMENIERIEIVRGGTSALYGADAVGGVINIITKKNGKNRFCFTLENTSYLPKKALKGSAEEGHKVDPDFVTLFDSQKAHIDTSYTINNISLNTSVNGILARNEYIFQEPEPGEELRIRQNANLLGGDATGNIFLSLPNGFFNLSGIGAYHEKGSPGNINYSTPDATEIQTGLGTSIQYKTDTFLTDILTLDIKAFYNYFNLDYNDPLFAEESSHTTHSGGIDLTQELFPTDFFSILYGGTLHYEFLESIDMGDRERLNCAGFVEVPFYINSYITLLSSLRYDYFSDFDNNLNFKSGLSWKLTETLALKASIAKSFRAPTFNDLYWPANAWAEGNPGLKPETGYNADLGITIIEELYNLNMFCFVRYMEDIIIWMDHDDFIWRPTNYNKGLYPGMEAQCDIQFLKNFTAGITYTLIYSFALTGETGIEDDLRIPYIPIHSGDVRLSYSTPKHTFVIHSHFEDQKYTDRENKETLPAFFILNASYTFTINDNFSIFIAADNILNQYIQSMENYPLPGFSLRTGCKVVF